MALEFRASADDSTTARGSSGRRVLLCAAAALVALHLLRDLVEFGTGVDTALAAWVQPATFLSCGVVLLVRGRACVERVPWTLIGCGLVIYGAGSVYYNLAASEGKMPPFPSSADVVWLALYPLVFVAFGMLVRARFAGTSAVVWLDGLIGGTAAGALVAAVLFDPVFDMTVADGAASIARLAYPVGDLVALGVVIGVWSIAGRRIERFWVLLGAGFALLAAGDSTYVVQAARGNWTPGNAVDYPYMLATMFIAAAAWNVRSRTRIERNSESTRLALPVACGLTALALVTLAVTEGLNPLATALSLLTLLAVVLRLGSTLARLNRQRLDLAALAASDPLTGLANHRTVHERLSIELERAQASGMPLSVVALDIDHFKTINDTYGHTQGDEALQAMAGVLRDQVRAHELVGRVGGEEFALLLPGATGDDAYEVAERCRAALSALLVHGVAVSCSAGVASYPSDGPDGARLLELADGALYWAKRSGRAQTKRYHPGEVVLLSSAEQRAQVQEVLARDDAMQPVFQPIVELATGRIAGYEALARFVHAQPVRTPDLWFSQARRCGLGPALEARALEVALAVQGRPAGTFLSLNVSPGALISAEVRAALPEDLSDIVIELTEDEVFSSDSALDAELAALRARGAKIAVDDAGAGYAGLQQLIRVKPEILKIDRSLISGVDEDSSKIALLEALTSFASSTGAAVCGEGIETLAELRMLARFDTTYAQGYALGRPGPAWSEGAADMAADTTAEVSMGMRLTRTAVDGDEGSLTPGEVAERLSRIRSQSELTDAIEMMRRLLHSDVVVVSRVRIDERRVETLSHNDWSPTERFYSYADFPTTGHVLEQQVLGQVISGDPAADPAELELLEGSGLHALLMAPILHRGETVGLLEICRREPRPWTGREIDRARLLAHSLGMAIRFEGREPLPWPTEALHIPAPTSGD